MKPAEFIDAFQPADGAPPRSLVAFVRWALAGSWPVLGLAILVSALAGTLDVISATILGLVVDSAVSNPGAQYFADNWLMLAGFTAFFLLARPLVIGLANIFESIVVAPNVFILTQARLHRWTMGQSIGFFDDDFAGRIAQKQNQTARALTDATVSMINVVAFSFASFLGSAVLLTSIDWRIALILVAWIGGYVLMMRWFTPRIKARSSQRASARAMVTGQIVDTVTNMKTVKLFAHSAHEDQAALEAMQGFRERSIEFGNMAALFRFTQMTFAGALPVFLIGATLMLWSNGAASPGDIAAAGAIAIRIAQMSGWVGFSIMGIYANVGEVEDGMATLTPPHTVTDVPNAKPISVTHGRIDFQDLTFTYGGGKNGVKNVNLTIAPGEKVGLVGASGAGKSTLVALLLRLYDPEAGRVLIDGQDLQQVAQESFRREIGMVTQETAMFNRSARDNILYGSPDANEDELIAAARQAEAHEFILELEDFKGRAGYDAYLGERGVKLSGGQRQRIALARAILKNAPILVLDEATSALDSEVEASIQTALESLMEGKTVLAIAHRLSTLAQMDRIVVLDEGEIVEQGTHGELLAQNGLYARYWHRQSGGFIGLEAAE